MKHVNQQEFKEEIANNKLVLVDFYADWCGPCRMVAPVIKEIAAEAKNKVQVLKVNVDEERELALSYNISSIPTIMLFKNGQVVSEMLGFRPKTAIMNLINQHLQ